MFSFVQIVVADARQQARMLPVWLMKAVCLSAVIPTTAPANFAKTIPSIALEVRTIRRISIHAGVCMCV